MVKEQDLPYYTTETHTLHMPPLFRSMEYDGEYYDAATGATRIALRQPMPDLPMRASEGPVSAPRNFEHLLNIPSDDPAVPKTEKLAPRVDERAAAAAAQTEQSPAPSSRDPARAAAPR